MKQSLLLMVLAFGMFSINSRAQRKSLGQNVYGEINSNGVLVISGQGEIDKYVQVKFEELGGVRGEIPPKPVKEVIIEDGITSIGELAFYDCFLLENIHIPNTVKCIKDDAFHGCIRLKSITLPNSVTTIGANAFYGCVKLKTIVVPCSVTSIGNEAFQYCTGLESLSIPNSVTSIGRKLVYGCNSKDNYNDRIYYGKILSMPISIVEAGPSKWENLYISENSMNAYLQDELSRNLFGTIKEGRRITKISGGYLVEEEGGKGIIKEDKTWAVPLNPLWKNFTDIVLVNDKYVKVKSSNGYGLMTPDGRTVVSEKQGYSNVEVFTNNNVDYFKISKYGHSGLVDINGKEIVPLEVDALEQSGKGFMRFKLNGFYGIVNYAGKIIIPTDRGYTKIGDYVSFTKRFPYEMDGWKGECNNLGVQVSKIKVNNPVAQQIQTTSEKVVSVKPEKKDTIVIKTDPVPMQVWVQCTGCWGSGMCQSGCGGSGWYTGWSGNSTRCVGCGGSGRCQFCAGQGGHYEVQYK